MKQLYFGVVESRMDPLYLGRCKVRIVGVHTEDKVILPTEDLPWSLPMQPITSAGISGVGSSPTGVVEGAWVVIYFIDDNFQYPMMMGTVGGFNENLPFEFDNQETINSTKGYDGRTATSNNMANTSGSGPNSASVVGNDSSGFNDVMVSDQIIQSGINSFTGKIDSVLGGAAASITSMANNIVFNAMSQLNQLSALAAGLESQLALAGNTIDPSAILDEVKGIMGEAGMPSIDDIPTMLSAGQFNLSSITDPAMVSDIAERMQEVMSDIDLDQVEKLVSEGVDMTGNLNVVKQLAENGMSIVEDKKALFDSIFKQGAETAFGKLDTGNLG